MAEDRYDNLKNLPPELVARLKADRDSGVTSTLTSTLGVE